MKCDFLMFPGGTQVVNYLNIKLPQIINYADSCFCQMVNYYWFDIPKWIYSQADTLEKRTMEKSSLVIRSSDWAINCAINDYDCQSGNINQTNYLFRLLSLFMLYMSLIATK